MFEMAKEDMNKAIVIMVTGQIGSELTPKLKDRHGSENVVASDIQALTRDSR